MVVDISVHGVMLSGFLEIPVGAKSLVIACCESERCNLQELNKLGFATLLTDLTTNGEVMKGLDASILTERLIGVTKWSVESEILKHMNIGYLGVGFGVQIALSASAYWGTKIKAMAVVDGRPDLAFEVLDLIESPTLLIVGSDKEKTIASFRTAYQKIGATKKLEPVSDMNRVDELVGLWFVKHLE